MHIGIDVGGTHTDAVLMQHRTVLASVKCATTPDVTSGIQAAIRALQTQRRFASHEIRAVMIGTTHFTNAVVARAGLANTAIVRASLPAGTGVPPMSDWPADLAAAVGGHVYQVHGGNEFDGRRIGTVRFDELADMAEDMRAKHIETVAIVATFSPLSGDTENTIADFLAERLPGVHFSLSHRIGRIGLLERENATIVNAALLPLAAHTTDAFLQALQASGIAAPLYLSQNDGTLMDVSQAKRYPVTTFASGPTNSMRGAALLSGLDTCIVIDIGGTTADIGMVVDGFPRAAGHAVEIGGVRTNFRMPDVLSIGIGGGSVVTLPPFASPCTTATAAATSPATAVAMTAATTVVSAAVSADSAPTAAVPFSSRSVPARLAVGPRSVGFRLTEAALVFGGDTLTATDLAVAAGWVDIGDRRRVAHLDPQWVKDGLALIAARLAGAADRMRTSSAPVPLVLVGGGSILIDGTLAPFDTVIRPEHADVANAIGAAIAQVSGEVDRIVSLHGQTGETGNPGNRRHDAIEALKQEAIARAIAAGAVPDSVTLVDIDAVPIAYLPGDCMRIRVKAVGDLFLETMPQ